MNKKHLRYLATWGAIAQCTGDSVSRPHAIANIADQLHRLVRKHGNACVKYCNEPYVSYETDVQRIESKINTLLALETDDIRAQYQYDPRGYTVRFVWDGDTEMNNLTTVIQEV